MFTVIYKFLPDTHVEWRDVWIGGFVTSFLFYLGKLVLGLYMPLDLPMVLRERSWSCCYECTIRVLSFTSEQNLRKFIPIDTAHEKKDKQVKRLCVQISPRIQRAKRRGTGFHRVLAN
jgi:hypothetical protein